jgi:hypothetical protein
MTYHFPRTHFADTNTLQEQLTHIAGETCEALRASAKREGIDRITEEILDVLHSCETALWIIESEHGPRYVHDKMQSVINKNLDRGYYDARRHSAP